MAAYLALREMWRNRVRFFLFSLVIALITVLVLFVAALGEGLGSGNREYLEKLNADLIIYDAKAELSIPASNIPRSQLNSIRAVAGVRDVGPIGFSLASIWPAEGSRPPLDVSLIGVEPGRPGEPAAITGTGLRRRSGSEALIDSNVAELTGLSIGDRFAVRSVQGADETFYILQVIGITDSQKYAIRPAVILPYLTWDKVRSRPAAVESLGEGSELTANVIAVRLEDPQSLSVMKERLGLRFSDLQAADRRTAYEATPGYSAQQSTLNTQRWFALLIGTLVIGGFFQIQTLQKVPQIGVLKAIGAANNVVAGAALMQIVGVSLLGIAIGGAAAGGLSLIFPPNIPIIFNLPSALAAVSSLMIIGPIGGMVSVHYSIRVEPLTALGLNA